MMFKIFWNIKKITVGLNVTSKKIEKNIYLTNCYENLKIGLSLPDVAIII